MRLPFSDPGPSWDLSAPIATGSYGFSHCSDIFLRISSPNASCWFGDRMTSSGVSLRDNYMFV